MALTPRKHGVTITNVVAGAIALEVMASAIFGVVVIAEDAENDAFPVGQAVLVTDPDAAIADAGVEGTFSRTLRAIADCAGRAIGVVVRVAPGAGEDEEEIAAATDANVIAGFDVLRMAEQTLGVRPVVLAAPGLDTEPVVTALAVLAGRLEGFAYAAAIGDTAAEVAAYRGGFGQKELMLIDRDFTAFDAGQEEDDIAFAAARAVGMRVLLDRTIGYHKTISNVAVPGVSGIDQPRSWDLSSADTDMGLINGADVTGLIQRNGFRFWGNRTCSEDPRFAFESAVRTAQALRRTIVEGVFPFIDKPLRPSLAVDVLASINALFRREERAGRIIGAEAFLADGNTPEQLAAGKLNIGYRFTPCAPLEDLSVTAEITDVFYADFSQLVAATA